MIISAENKRLILSCTIVCMLTACGGDDMHDLEQYVDEVKARTPQPIEPLPEPKPHPKFVYQPSLTRPSPFLPVPPKKVAHDEDDALKPDQDRPKQPLEEYPLDSLNMVGKVKIDGVLWALVESSDGHVHRIRTGQYMGKNYGKVLEITPDQITIEETVRVANKWQKREVSRKLRSEEGE